jgi:hypothetical protein
MHNQWFSVFLRLALRAGLCTMASTMAAAALPSDASSAVPLQRTMSAAPRYSQLRYDTDYPTIDYSAPATDNPIARLQKRLERGEVRLESNGPRGYLDSLLVLLEIDPSSQVLVYSKTSLQVDHISAATPRAIYFNDDTYVAWVQGSNLLEMSVMDASRGAVFYSLDNRPEAPSRFERHTSECLACHDTYSMAGGGVPRFLIDSTLVDTNGIVVGNQISHETDDRTPLSDRWGGWYVTGVPDAESHLGNIQIRSSGQLVEAKATPRGTLASLTGLFDTAPYITDKSDIVALLVLEHQLEVKNLIIRTNFKARSFLARDTAARAPETVTLATAAPATQAAVRHMMEELVEALLFKDAVAYRNPIVGSSGYDRWFAAQGPRDAQGRSLRDFDLHTRLFRYPLSYVIYSEAFDALPEDVKQGVYARIWKVLSGQDDSGQFDYLSANDKTAMLQILTATKPDFGASLAAAR